MEWLELKTDPAQASLDRRRAQLAQQAATDYLARTGLRVLARGWQCAAGQIDIVAADRRVLVVCLVKVRSGRSRTPLEAITRSKARRLRRLSVQWITVHGVLFEEIRIDILGLTPAPLGEFTIEHVRGVG